MKKSVNSLFIRGIGVGMIIVSALFYFAVFFSNLNKPSDTINDKVVIERAKELGMVFITEIEKKEDKSFIVEEEESLINDEDIISE